MRTTVGIIGGGPAGLLLARLPHRADIDCVALESRTRAHGEQGRHAGLLEQGTVDALRACGAAERLETEGRVQHGVELRFDRERHRLGRERYRLGLPALTGGRTVTVHDPTELVKDLVALATRRRSTAVVPGGGDRRRGRAR